MIWIKLEIPYRKVSEKAKEIGISQPTLAKLCKGAKRIDLVTLNKLCNYYKCTPNDILIYVPDLPQEDKNQMSLEL